MLILKPLLDKTTIVSFVTGCRYIITADIYNWIPHYDHLVTAPYYPAEPPPVLCWPLTCDGVARGSCHRVLSDAATLLSLSCIIVKLRQGWARNGPRCERPQSLKPCLELTLKLVATFPPPPP